MSILSASITTKYTFYSAYNLANRRYLKTIVRGIGSLRSPIPVLLKLQEKILPSVACHGTFLLKKGTRKYICRCPSSIQKSCDKSQLSVKSFLVAEREGFEPPEPRSSTVFKTAAIDHSAISPGAKVEHFFVLTKFFCNFFSLTPSKLFIINKKSMKNFC